MLRALVMLVTSPRDYWYSVVSAPGDIRSLLLPRILLLATAPALASLVGTLLGGVALALKVGFLGRIAAGALFSGVVYLGLNLGIWIALGFIIDHLAPSFMAQRDLGQAMKLSSGTVVPIWLGGILHVTSSMPLGLMGTLLGLAVGVHGLYVGLPIMNGTPPDRAAGYALAAMAILFVAHILVSILVGCPVGCMTASMVAVSAG